MSVQQITNITASSNQNIITLTNSIVYYQYCILKSCYITNPYVILISNINRHANIVVLANLITTSITSLVPVCARARPRARTSLPCLHKYFCKRI